MCWRLAVLQLHERIPEVAAALLTQYAQYAQYAQHTQYTQYAAACQRFKHRSINGTRRDETRVQLRTRLEGCSLRDRSALTVPCWIDAGLSLGRVRVTMLR